MTDTQATPENGQGHAPLPVHGYREQSAESIAKVNEMKVAEETILRELDKLRDMGSSVDQGWLARGRHKIEEGFMCVNRSIMQPGRINLPG